MKKFLYILLFVAVSAVTFSACSEEVVTPKTEDATNGGSSQDPIKNG